MPNKPPAGRRAIELKGECRVCHRATRKPSQTLKAKPGTVKGADATGELCITCAANPDTSVTVGRWLPAGMDPDEKARRIAAAQADLEAMARDRRARGISPTGTRFPGDPVPIRELGSGFCKNGHAYDPARRTPDGRNRCPICENARRRAARAKRLADRDERATYGLAS